MSNERFKIQREAFLCECQNSEHQFIFSVRVDEDSNQNVSLSLSLDVYLSKYRNFFQRILIAVKYVFGFRSDNGAFDSVMLSKEDAVRIRSLMTIVTDV